MERFKINQLQKGSRIHFIGIGGVSMRGLAEIAVDMGMRVTGSDRADSDSVQKLRKMGAEVFIGHKKEQVKGADLAVHTAAVHTDNPEMQGAVEYGIRLIDRAEFLGAVMEEYSHSVGIAGTHGKTTTTSMIAHALLHAGADPTISVGGNLDLIGGNVRVGSGCFVTEACEYTNSFLKLFPTVAVITNIEEDHLDFFSGIDEIIQSFREFAELTRGKGSVVAWGEDENIRRALAGCELSVITYGMGGGFDYYPQNLTWSAGFAEFDVFKRGEYLCRVKLNVPGEHNVLNALASIAVCELLGEDAGVAAEGIATFFGTRRRFEKKGEIKESGAVVIDDYAHHPTEIRATIRAAQNMPHNRIWVAFQPHTYSRTRSLWDSFAEAFGECDKLILADIYPAREEFDGVTRSEDLAAAIRERGTDAVYMDSFEKIADYIKRESAQGDMVFTMGAGNITDLGAMLTK